MNKNLNKNTLWDRLKNCLQLSSVHSALVVAGHAEMPECVFYFVKKQWVVK